ncbi:MAG TPA: peptide deformylase [Gemmatimonadales bacterium]|jgi:peptide deformylase|nr:peptide deformylase [Gemmatimonadales bacterium]
MAVRALHLLGSPVLRQRSPEVARVDDEVRRFVADLFETMDANKGVGLAANQVGVATRVAVVDADDQRFAIINPKVVSTSGPREAEEEGCLSIPDLFAEVGRPARVVVEALDEEGQPIRIEAEGLLARALQHEIDHLDGILFIDHLGPMKRQMLVAKYKREHPDAGTVQARPAEPAARPE